MAVKKIEMNQKRTDGGFDIFHPITSVENVIGAETPAGAQAKANQAENNAKGHANWLVGDLNQLQTGNKSNLVSAMNETFQSGVDAKRRVVAELNAKKIPATMNDPWATLAAMIGQIKTELKFDGKNNSGEYSKISVSNLGFEPIVVIVRANFHVRDPGFWISSTVELPFIKGHNNGAGSNLDSYVNGERYANGGGDIEWAANGFTVTGSVGYGSYEQKSISLQSWKAYGF